MDGFDVASALARCKGDVSRYLEFLRMFRDRNAEAMSRLASTIAAGDSRTAISMTHAIRGSAGAIGATMLEAAAAALEESLRKSEIIPEFLAALNTAWDRSLRFVTKLLGESQPDEDSD